MRTNQWLVIVIVASFIGFLLGYSISSYTGIHEGGNMALETGGYGGGGDEAASEDLGESMDKEALDYYKQLGQDAEE